MVKLSVLLTTLCLQVAYGRRVPAVYGQETVQDTMRLDGENPDDNEVSVLPEGNLRTFPLPYWKNYVEIEKFPQTDVNKLIGERIEFSCDASGSPPPLIQWYKENRKVTQNEKSVEDNLVIENSPGYGKVKSRLIIEHVLPIHRGVYYCEATANTKVDRRQVYLNVPNAEGRDLNMTELVKLKIVGSFHPPRVTFWADTYFMHLNADIVLPCKSHGNPLPDLYWVTPDNQVITKKEPSGRLSVSSYGELTIRKLAWQDMGLYTCYLQNREGDDQVTTFVYPMAKK